VSVSSPIQPFLDANGVLILDGGLATELEFRGCDLKSSLWSASVLENSPQILREVYTSYLDAGADCISTASYQATVSGFVSAGHTEEGAIALIQSSVDIAAEARNTFASNNPDRLRPIVAASVGPYGAFLSDGSEYTGAYSLSRSELMSFHEPRWHILTESGADLMACETIPNLREAEALVDLLSKTPDRTAWMSFSCRDGAHISDGTPMTECAALLDECDQVVAIGVNCVAPHLVSSLISELSATIQRSEIIVYPNSGEVYDAGSKTWSGMDDSSACARAASEWYAFGARLIGGCCRTSPEQIRSIRAHFGQSQSAGSVS